MRNYLEGYDFIVLTDHQSLKWLQRLEELIGLGQWLFELQQYSFEVKYRKDALNKIADALFRRGEVCKIQTDKRCT